MDDGISAALRRLEAGERVVLCTILKSDGSAPRHAGTRMAILADGSLCGTVGGGAVEQQARVFGQELLRQGRSALKRYETDQSREEDIGLTHVGSVLLGFCCLTPQDAPTLAAWRSAAQQSGRAWLRTEFFPDGRAVLGLLTSGELDGEEPPRRLRLEQTAEKTVLLEPVCGEERVWLFGGGHVGAALAPVLASVGFRVTVYDERGDFARAERYPAAERVVHGRYEELAQTVSIRPGDCVIATTAGHRGDYTVLRQALGTEAGYIGCIGSRKKIAYIRALLREEGFSEAEVARIHAPIGLPIGAETPEEIAVSITAELIRRRRLGG